LDPETSDDILLLLRDLAKNKILQFYLQPMIIEF